jgi:hypothetical protein
MCNVLATILLQLVAVPLQLVMPLLLLLLLLLANHCMLLKLFAYTICWVPHADIYDLANSVKLRQR